MSKCIRISAEDLRFFYAKVPTHLACLYPRGEGISVIPPTCIPEIDLHSIHPFSSRIGSSSMSSLLNSTFGSHHLFGQLLATLTTNGGTWSFTDKMGKRSESFTRRTSYARLG